MTWQNGRQLASLQTSDNSVSYKYDSNGMRTQKTDNSGTTYYYYDSNKNLIGLTRGNDTLLFYYDSDNSVTSFKYNGTMYYYIKNLQGDIVKILDQSGTEVASYVYDAWGNIKSTTGNATLKELNPFRYRSYLYDEETRLYYLQSRYYDPFTGRFINADDTEYIGATGTALSTNIFTYCDNNPVNNTDAQGKKTNKNSSGSAYKRNKAVKYAKDNYQREEDTDCFRYYKDEDCANFVSQCVAAGGIKKTYDWYFYINGGFLGRDLYTKSWVNANAQYRYFSTWGFSLYGF